MLRLPFFRPLECVSACLGRSVRSEIRRTRRWSHFLQYLGLSRHVKVSGFNEKAAEVRPARGLHLPDRPHDSKPAVSMLILAGAPRALPPLARRGPLTVTNWLPAWSSAVPYRTVPSNNNGQRCLDNGPPDKLGSLYSPPWPRLLFPPTPLLLLGSSALSQGRGGRCRAGARLYFGKRRPPL